MNTANKYKGYFDFPVGEGETKKMHFSMNFVFLLQDITEKDLTTWLTDLEKASETDQGFGLCQIVFAALAAYDLEEENEVDYNVYKVRNWVFNALMEDPDLPQALMKAMTDALGGSLGKMKAKKK